MQQDIGREGHFSGFNHACYGETGRCFLFGGEGVPVCKIQVFATVVYVVVYHLGKRRNAAVPRPDGLTGVAVPTGGLEEGFEIGGDFRAAIDGRGGAAHRHKLSNDKKKRQIKNLWPKVKKF